MSKTNQNTDLKTLLQNLKDLNDITQKVTNETEQKNKILQGGLRDCKTCQGFLDIKKNNNQ